MQVLLGTYEGIQCKEFFKRAQFHQKKTGEKRALNGRNYKISTKKTGAFNKNSNLLP
jgi:hypothetical protein